VSVRGTLSVERAASPCTQAGLLRRLFLQPDRVKRERGGCAPGPARSQVYRVDVVVVLGGWAGPGAVAGDTGDCPTPSVYNQGRPSC
jgi:hypothetical protein